MSLADVLAVSTSARNLILLGDPQQLAQPSTGTHPDGAGASALEHLLDGQATIPAELGLFLDTTWRMHPAVCRFVSDVAYDGRLESEPDCARQAVDGGAGLWWVPVDHDGDRTRAPAEAEAVLRLVKGLVGTTWRDRDGVERALEPADVLVVAPYNAHVHELRLHVPDGVPVGTVDKFQGREGAVAIYAMASSSVEDAPRGMTFLYDLHRLNVAASRARARAYVVASPALLRVVCHTPAQVRLANALCRFVELADEQTRGRMHWFWYSPQRFDARDGVAPPPDRPEPVTPIARRPYGSHPRWWAVRREDGSTLEVVDDDVFGVRVPRGSTLEDAVGADLAETKTIRSINVTAGNYKARRVMQLEALRDALFGAPSA
jgi:hypothetical protein